MFGFVTANLRELTKEQRQRYNAVYCGICRQIRDRSGQLSRLGLSYDMAFLALLLMSPYEPEEVSGKGRCALHPVKPKPWLDNEYIRYAADMNVALAYYKAEDDRQDDGSLSAKLQANIFGKSLHELVSEDLSMKLRRMPDDARMKLSETLERIINEGSGGLICILL